MAVIKDDASNDWGTRYVPDRNVPPDAHLGGVPNTSLLSGRDEPRLSKPLPDRLEDPVIPDGNVPLEKAIQVLIDKALSERDKKEKFTESEVFGVPHLTDEEREKADEADRKATEKLEKDSAKAAKLA